MVLLSALLFSSNPQNDLIIFVSSSDPLLENPYSILITNPENFQDSPSVYNDLKIKYYASIVFVAWLLEQANLELLKNFTIKNKFVFKIANNTIRNNFQVKYNTILNENESVLIPTSLLIGGSTTLDSTGILNLIQLEFEKTNTNITLLFTIKGSGALLLDGRSGNLNVIISHSPEQEIEYINNGFALYRINFINSSFILIGPTANQANLQNNTNILEAFNQIQLTRSIFISRGDSSGTHFKELEIWMLANISIDPNNSTWNKANIWYVETGNSQANSFRIAQEKNGYMLIDEPTFLVLT